MVLKYYKFLLRTNWQFYLIALGLCLILSLTMPLWTFITPLTGLIGVVISFITYFITYWPAWLYYRSLYGSEAQLTHQIPVKGEKLLTGHLLFGISGNYLCALLMPAGLLNFIFRPEMMVKSNVMINIMSREQMTLETQELQHVLMQMHDYMLHSPAGLVLLLFYITGPICSYMMAFTAISHGCRKGAGKNRLLSVLLTYLLIIFGAGVVLVVPMTVSTLFLVLNGQFIDSPAAGTSSAFSDLLNTASFQNYLLFLGVLISLWSILITLLCWLYTRKQLNEKVNLT